MKKATKLPVVVPKSIGEIIPKPTKAEVRRAMAIAIRNKQQEQWDANDKIQSDLQEKWRNSAMAFLKEYGKFENPSCGWGKISVDLIIEQGSPHYKQLKDSHDKAFKNQGRVQEVSEIEKELIAAEKEAAGSSVEAILSNPSIVKQLLEAGTRLIAGKGAISV